MLLNAVGAKPSHKPVLLLIAAACAGMLNLTRVWGRDVRATYVSAFPDAPPWRAAYPGGSFS